MPDPRAHSTTPMPEPKSLSDPAALVLCAMQFAVFERQAEGVFSFVNDPPGWFLQLVPEGDARASANNLAEYFPMLDVFLPMAESFWQTTSSERLQSEFWTESDASGTEYHLQAFAFNALACKTSEPQELHRFLVLDLADATYNERQQVQLYAHEMSMSYDTIARLNQEVERATRAKSDFLASMSHEIRTPLNAILGMADLLSASDLNHDQRKYVAIFQRAGSNLLNLINDILDLSKVEAGQLSLEAIDFELADVVGRATELIRVRALEKGLAVTSAIAPELPPWFIGDPTRLRQVLLNLLGNSMKFTDRGSLHVAVQPDPDDATPGSVRFAIRDTGIGIPADKLTSIFENFTQADTSTTRKYGGTGLGLSISRHFVELMGGRLWVESELGKGSTFFFTAKFGVSDRRGAILAAGETPAVRNPTAADLTPMHILLADDSADNRFLIEAYLKGSACVLQFAENGEIALSKMQTEHYDLVLMDAHMPVMDGYTATEQFRDWERIRNQPPLPVLALTADAFKESIEKSVQVGFNAHLTKPIRQATLVEAIKKYALPCDRAMDPPVVTVYVDGAIAEIAPIYLENIRNDLGRLEEAEKEQDFDTIRTLGHNLKGTGASYGFARISEIGAVMEQAAKDQSIGPARACIGEFKSYLENVRVEREQE